jgi:hypothetical protein
MTDFLTFFASIRKVETLQDGALRLRVDTQEKFPPTGAAVLLAMVDGYGSFGIKVGEAPINPKDVPDFTPEFKDDKSPSERLRNVMWVYHSQKKIAEPFESWRKNQIEAIISKWKESLDPL